MNEMGVFGGGGSGRFETPEEFLRRKSLWATPERGTDGGSARGLSARKLRSKMSHTFRIPYFECSECGEEFALEEVDLLEDEDGDELVECPECGDLLYLTEDDDEDEKEGKEGEEKSSKKGKLTSEMKAAIENFVRENPSPDDEDFHDLADELGIHPAKAEEYVYKLAHKLMKEDDDEEDDEDEKEGKESKVGKSLTWKDLKYADVDDEEFDPRQLKMGIKVEKEHVDDTSWAKAIAKSHLKEIPDYYTRLDKMEKEAGKSGNGKEKERENETEKEESIASGLVDLIMEGNHPADVVMFFEEEL